MMSYVYRRLLQTVPVMLVVSLVVFSLLYFAPGDPVAIIAGENASPADLERIRLQLGLDQPYLIRFANWIMMMASGDLGTSFYTNQPVSQMILERVGPTLSLTLISVVMAVAIAVPAGVLSAWKANTAIDRFIMLGAVLGFSIPVFIVAYLATYIFAVSLRWLPVQGYRPLSDGVVLWLTHLILPSLALCAVYVGLIARTTRASMMEVLSQDYIRTAHAKGLRLIPILTKHALRNASIPVVTVIGIGLAVILGGAVVVESIYALPGLGRLTIDAVARRDYPVIQGVVLVISLGYIFVNLIVDILYVVLDPRIRY